MKFILALVIFGCILYFGWFLYEKTRKKLVFYNNFLQFCNLLETEIGFFQNNIEEILHKNNYKKEFSEVVENFSKSKNLLEWKNSQSVLTQTEAEEVELFFSKLGKLDSTSQTNEVKSYKKFLDSKIEDTKKVNLKNGKLTFNLSIMLGLLVFIIII